MMVSGCFDPFYVYVVINWLQYPASCMLCDDGVCVCVYIYVSVCISKLRKTAFR